MFIRCGGTRWNVHRSIVLYRSAYLEIKVDISRMHRDQIAGQFSLWVPKGDHNPLLVDAYLVWLYTRSSVLVAEAIDTSFRGNEAFGWMAFFRFAIETNMPRRGFEGVERDNNELIKALSEEISQMFKDDIEALVVSAINVQKTSEGDLESIAEAFGRIYLIAEEVDEDKSAPAMELMKAIIGHMVFQALLLEGVLRMCGRDCLVVVQECWRNLRTSNRSRHIRMT